MEMEPSTTVSEEKTPLIKDGSLLELQKQNQLSVEAYLNEGALMKNVVNQDCIDEEPAQLTEPRITLTESEVTGIVIKRLESPFHNLHKHIITLLRKRCKFALKTFQNDPYGRIAYALWQVFEKMRSSSKKVFNIIFGYSNTIHLHSNINLLAGEFKQFRKVKEKYDLSQLLKAQDLLRSRVCSQMQNLSRQDMQQTCRMKNFEMFYIYVCWFMEKLKEGQINQRITKKEMLTLLYSQSLELA